ncbi:WG repeat-containing protein [Neptunitalea lumnitzerae]|uniref:WG containing repeat-containing protein n=1 Tax=Neptunitalea lumnitzerae TaxID=2965509 RepID=A0ABQ5MET8_9FLAO|nr:WG repeat-containing protein [Neptunitalea sp. Y10]GLB47883.1 hypothetical protein Y10_02510 [Neptunitalea sp. Y10]
MKFFLFAAFLLCGITLVSAQVTYATDSPHEKTDSNPYSHFYKLPAQPNGKTGVIKGKDTIIPPKYDIIYKFENRGYFVQKGDKMGYFGKDGEEIIPVKYDSLIPFKTINYYTYSIKTKNKGLYGLMNIHGIEYLKAEYKDILGFNTAKQYAVYDKKGNLTIISESGKNKKLNPDKIIFYENALVLYQGGKVGFFTNDTFTGYQYDIIKNGISKIPTPLPDAPKETISYINTKLEYPIAIQNGKVGLLNLQGEVLIPFKYNGITKHNNNDYFTYKDNNLLGIYFRKTNTYIPAKYQKIQQKGQDNFIVSENGKYGVLDYKTGAELIPSKYKRITIYGSKSNPIYEVKINHKYGFIDANGKMILEPEYDAISKIYGARGIPSSTYITKKDSLHGLFDIYKGKLMPVKYLYIGSFANKYLMACTPAPNRKYGLFNYDGTTVLDTEYDNIYEKRDSHYKNYKFKKDGLYGFIDTNGKVTIPAQYTHVTTTPTINHDIIYPEGVKNHYQTISTKNGKNGVINRFTNTIPIPAEYDTIVAKLEDTDNNEVYFVAKHEKYYGIIDDANKIIVPFKYDTLDLYLNEEYQSFDKADITFAASKKGKFGILNLNEKEILPFKYEYISKVSAKNLFKVRENGAYNLYKNNVRVTTTGYDEISEFEGSKALAFKNNKMVEIDLTGKVLTQPVPMQPHQGFTSMYAMKKAFYDAMETNTEEAFRDLAKKMAPSPHLMYFFKHKTSRIQQHISYLNYENIEEEYYQILIKIRGLIWSYDYDKRNLLDTEDYTIIENGIETNTRTNSHTYDNKKYVEKFLRNSLKINGYWISSYFFRF